MGWTEGKAIGRATKGEVEAYEIKKRPQRLGLGAAPAPEVKSNRIPKPGTHICRFISSNKR